jgi:thiamine biosynthesis lipoprotein
MGAATSGTTKRMWGPGLHHLIDPRTSRPAVSDLKEVSVIAETATDAEIYAKVALLIGSAAATKWLGGRALGWSFA